MLKDLTIFPIDDLVLFDLDDSTRGYFPYHSDYDDYFVWQVYADEIAGQLCVCVDISKNNPEKILSSSED